MTTAENIDCMVGMGRYPDKWFHLAVCDFPYGIGEDGAKNHSRGKPVSMAGSKAKGAVASSKWIPKQWDKAVPPIEVFNEVRRVSKNQIFWGANHFISRIPFDSPCWIIWDKMNGDSDFSDCELAWTSFKTAARKFEFKWNGMLQQDMKNKEKRIHPTQKPVALYRWIFQNYAKPGQRILDPMMGSGSSRIAAHDMGFEYVGFELDTDYFTAQEARFADHIAKPQLFAPEQIYTFKQESLFAQ